MGDPDKVIKFRTDEESAEVGDVIRLPSGRIGVKVHGDHVVWRRAHEDDDWWLHRAANMKQLLDDVAARNADGSLHPGTRG